MKIIYIGMPLYKCGDQSVNSGKRQLMNKKVICKFQTSGGDISSFYAPKKKKKKGM